VSRSGDYQKFSISEVLRCDKLKDFLIFALLNGKVYDVIYIFGYTSCSISFSTGNRGVLIVV